MARFRPPPNHFCNRRRDRGFPIARHGAGLRKLRRQNWDARLHAPVAEALALQRPFPVERMQIVAAAAGEDEAA